MKKAYIWPILLVLGLVLTCCGRGAAYTTDNAFSNWNDQVQTDMADPEAAAWSYTLTALHYPLTYYSEDERALVRGDYAVPRVQVFHAEGTPYDEKAEALSAAVMVAQRVNTYFENWFALQRQNYAELCAVAERSYTQGDAVWTAEDYCYTDSVDATFWNNGHIACVTFTSDSFTGGEYSITRRTAVTFDMRTGAEITINDMVDDYAGLRDAVALEILSQIEDGRYVKYYQGELLFSDYKETIPEWMTRALFFGGDSMTVVFSAYDIAPYSAGEQAFVIPYTLIEPYLNDYGCEVLEIT